MFPRNETGTSVRSPKPPFYETARLSPSDLHCSRNPSVLEFHGFSGRVGGGSANFIFMGAGISLNANNILSAGRMHRGEA